MSARIRIGLCALVVLLGGCAITPEPAEDRFGTPAPRHEKDRAPAEHEIPADIALTPNPEVRDEPKSRYGNPVSYEVFGQRYFVLDSAEGYRERGYASWYGKKFHGRRTSSGEPYDMYKMTAAHRTLPLPSYVRVTHLGNGRSAIVRVNDRGPFHDDRIIDLSYAAAARLGMTEQGHARVEVEALTPPGGTPADDDGGGYLRAWQPTEDPVEAVQRREQLLALGVENAAIHLTEDAAGEARHELRIGPLESAEEAAELARWLRARDIPAQHLRAAR
jgi:rare lipoprotein A